MKVKFKEWDCDVVLKRYDNDRIALLLTDVEDGSPVAKATTNIPEVPLGAYDVIIKDYMENEGMKDALVKAGIVDTDVLAWAHPFSYVVCPVMRLSKEFKQEYGL
jgi:hypothetical protein